MPSTLLLAPPPPFGFSDLSTGLIVINPIEMEKIAMELFGTHHKSTLLINFYDLKLYCSDTYYCSPYYLCIAFSYAGM